MFCSALSMVHRLETNKLRNMVKFFAHLLDINWRICRMSNYLSTLELSSRTLSSQEFFESIFPKDNPKNTRFAINFFTSIGLGGITKNLREYLKNMPRFVMQKQKAVPELDSESNSSSSSDSDGSGSGSL